MLLLPINIKIRYSSKNIKNRIFNLVFTYLWKLIYYSLNSNYVNFFILISTYLELNYKILTNLFYYTIIY